jgi:hypothetical protein
MSRPVVAATAQRQKTGHSPVFFVAAGSCNPDFPVPAPQENRNGCALCSTAFPLS